MKTKLVIIFILISSLLFGSVKKPADFFGFQLGADKKLAGYDQIKEYFIHIGKNSPRVKSFIIGKTTLKEDMILSVISSSENIKSLDRYKDISKKLSLAEIHPIDAKKLAKEGKVIVFITCNLHSTEIGSSQMAPKILYDFATKDSKLINNILDKVLFVLIPSLNPDGQKMVVDWYNQYQGTEFEGGSMPYLYHWYAGHDNNRDWYKQNLAETQAVSKQAYFNYFPQIWVDEHQMGSSGDRFFVPPFQDPPTPYVHPLVWRTINIIGTGIGFDLQKIDYSGVASRGFFTGWWIGAVDDTAWFHNIAGILFEAASVKIASPIYIEPEEVRSGESLSNSTMIFSPDPWPGGYWRLSDIVNYDYHSTISVLKTAADYKEELLLNSYKMAADNINKGLETKPYGFIIPLKQHDILTAEKLIMTLLMSNIRVYKTLEPIKTDNNFFQKGSFYIPLAQPYRAFVLNLLTVQHYPDIRTDSKASPIIPYDCAGWTLSYGMNVKVIKIKEKIQVKKEPVTLGNIYKRAKINQSDTYLVLDSNHNNTFAAVSYLLQNDVKVYRDLNGTKIKKGSFVLKSTEGLEKLNKLMKTIPLEITSLPQVDLSKLKRIRNFKVGLYQNWGGNMREGWMRYVLDEFKINYKTLHNKDIKNKNLSSRYDVLIFNNVSKERMISGEVPKKYRRWFSPLPKKYRGGIDKDGFNNLTDFLKKGKTIIFLGSSCEYAIEKFSLPVTDISKKAKLLCPGSYLKAMVKDTKLTYGLEEIIYVMFDSGTPFFRTFVPKNVMESRRTSLVFPQRDILASGWLGDESILAKKSLVVNNKKYQGNIVLIGPDIIHRAQSEGAYKLLFNAFFINSYY